MNLFFLDAAAAAAPQGGLFGGSIGTIIMMVVLILIFWLFFIRPQSKRQKELQRKRDAMQAGDKVVTAGGIHGKICEVNERDFLIEVARDVRIRVEKTSVYAAVEDVAKQ
ncbi:preprotein translocase subunit YajC [Porphyromonas circumdentaria]|uniref:Sec translocon accessory complex subunit YajC n=1 Tax=Porphyromonas circumdentaria TaxID=29524 RepID=A0A1T4LD08_9PORP|nr:preprotein translocase subunit YajC [Porphyromonas circumdentaria]MBB6275310.1 preprotein translocase subunit YajC [Porphyromonas circumdentaria]MDO4722011.1 preprotein translocase subunit YajC [Porphyromonas circumdentaria]SJZ52536.1 protein translocase subunit yajC [Porphyromonas circumdentaria]